MPLYRCTNCDHPVYFENPRCLRCNALLGFDAERRALYAFEAGTDAWYALSRFAPRVMGTGAAQFAPAIAQGLLPCENRDTSASCNWMRAQGSAALCRACALTTMLPDQSSAANRDAWRQAEQAKRRWLLTVLELGLDAPPRDEAHPQGLQVRIVEKTDGEPAITGHADGVITINASECDPVARLRQRTALDEPYRTVLGHFRHESGHYFWQVLISEYPARLAAFREVFGDERADYTQALRSHYHLGAPDDWQNRFVSAYAASHPWEDFAETWAHYLHMVDLVELADAWGLDLRNYPDDEARAFANGSGTHDPRFESLLERWLQISLFANSTNRSLGHEDAYPFAPAPAALKKMGWIHRLVAEAGSAHMRGPA